MSKDYKKIMTDNKDDVDMLLRIVNECNSYSGALEDYQYYDNDESFFGDMFGSDDVMNVVRAISFGEYSYTHDYVKFNGYGNIDSYSEYDRDADLKDGADEIIDTAMDMENDIDMDYIIGDLERIEV